MRLEYILHTFLHVLIESLKLVPFLFLMYLFLEWVEHKSGEHTEKIVAKTGRAGPLFGAVLGLLPQCGFSTAAAGLYSGGIITAGTLLAVFLSTSDEMIAVLLSNRTPVKSILILLGLKLVIALVAGFVTDLFLKKSRDGADIENHCHEEGCHCHESGILRSAIFHTVKIFAFIFVISFAVHMTVEAVGQDNLGKLFSDIPFISNVAASLIGLIPNCAASVVLVQLWLEGVISAGAMLSGLLVGAGTGLLVLLRVNRHHRENARFILILFLVGALSGFVLDLVGLEGWLL